MIDNFKSPPQTHFNGQQIGWLVEQYLAACAGKVAPVGIRKYAQRLRHFQRWAEQYEAIGRPEMSELGAYLAASHLAIGTQESVIRRTRQVFRWAYAAGYAEADYSLWLPVIRAPQTIFRPVSPADVQALLKACEQSRYAQRDQAMIALMAGAGLRTAEAAAIERDDCMFDDNGMLAIRVRCGKGSKSRTVIVSREWATIIAEQCAEVTEGPLLTSQKGDMMTGNSLYHTFKAIAERAGLRCSGCHDLRRYFATQWMRRFPAHPDELRRQMGHSDFSTTSLYILSAPEDIRSLVRNSV